MKTKLEKDVEATIRVLRFLTGGQGYAGLSVFDCGSGGGFSTGNITVNLERDGLILKADPSSTPEEFKSIILGALHCSDKEKLNSENESYKRRPWNEE